jgi:chromosome segregation ATPase
MINRIPRYRTFSFAAVDIHGLITTALVAYRRMNDTPDDVDVESLRDRLRGSSIDVDENVLNEIDARTVDGSVDIAAFEAWYDDCTDRRRSVTERTERFESRLDEYRASLGPVERDFDHVRVRFEEYDERFDAIRTKLESVADRIETASRTPASATALYETARLLSASERTLHGIAHELGHIEEALDDLESWLTDPAVRLDDFDDELDTVERYLDNTDRLLTNVEAHAADPPAGFRPFDAWLTARHLHLLVAVVFEELKADVDELGRWVERCEGDHGAALAALTDRLDALADRHASFERRIDDATDAIAGFEEKYAAVAAEVDRFAAELDAVEPPIDWATLEERIDEQFDSLGISHG